MCTHINKNKTEGYKRMFTAKLFSTSYNWEVSDKLHAKYVDLYEDMVPLFSATSKWSSCSNWKFNCLVNIIRYSLRYLCVVMSNVCCTEGCMIPRKWDQILNFSVRLYSFCFYACINQYLYFPPKSPYASVFPARNFQVHVSFIYTLGIVNASPS